MILFLLFYFYDYLNSEEYNNNPSQILSTQTGVIWVHDASFHNMNNGAIRISAGPCILTIEDSLFTYCYRSTGSGGAVFLQCNCCESIISRTCGYFCYSGSGGSHGQFSYTETFSERKNQLLFSSLSYCSPYFNQDRRSSSSLVSGKILVKNFNSSFNYAFHNSGIRVESLTSNNVEYSTFINNYVSEHSILGFYSGKSNYSNSNLKNNSQKLSTYGLVRTSESNLQINLCIFLENFKTLFYAETSTITISNSWIDIFSKGGNVLTSNINFFTATYSLFHINTIFCKAELPIIINKTNNKIFINSCYNSNNKNSILSILIIRFLFLF